MCAVILDTDFILLIVLFKDSPSAGIMTILDLQPEVARAFQDRELLHAEYGRFVRSQSRSQR